MMVSRTFTFGFGQIHPVTMKSLSKHYITVTAETAEHCRLFMLNRFGNNWAFEYRSPVHAGASRFTLHNFRQRHELPPDSGKYEIGKHGTCILRADASRT